LGAKNKLQKILGYEAKGMQNLMESLPLYSANFLILNVEKMSFRFEFFVFTKKKYLFNFQTLYPFKSNMDEYFKVCLFLKLSFSRWRFVSSLKCLKELVSLRREAPLNFF